MADPRCHPLIELDPARIREMLRPVLHGAEPLEIARVEGGLVNTTYRIRPAGREAAYALRIYAGGRAAFEKERRLIPALKTELPVPTLLFADAGGALCGYPYLVYGWIEGVTLNRCRGQMPHASLLSLAKPLGALLATVACISKDTLDERARALLSSLSVESLLAINDERLRQGRARERLGARLADELRRCLEARAAHLTALDGFTHLVHGDFGGRNILVAPERDGDRWRISGLIDWEAASSGSALWDVGSLFRYSRRYSENFCKGFESGYAQEACGTLPEDWRRTARLLDSVRVVEILDDERELPIVFAECRELISALVSEMIGRANPV